MRKFCAGDYDQVLQSDTCRKLFNRKGEDERTDLETILQTNLSSYFDAVPEDKIQEKYVF